MRLLCRKPNRCRWRTSSGGCDMRNRLISTAVIVLCVCLSACGIQEEVIPEEPAEQGDIIAEGSGNDAPDGGTQAAEPEDIADPGESGQTDENALSPDSLPVLETGTLSECITLCQLDGLKVIVTLEEDPDEEDALIYARLLKDAKPLLDPESGIRPGDVVSIDMYAVEDGDKDLTRLGVSVLVGAGTQPEEIEDALIGMRRDEEKKVTVMYPEDYLFMGLGGRTVRYRICVDSIARPDEPSETETGKALTYLEEETERVNRERLTEAVMEALIENSEIRAYPEKVVRQARSRYERKYTAGFENLDDFLNLTGMPRAEFKEAEDEYVSRRAKEQLVLMALQEETGITRTSEEYRQYTAVHGVNDEDPDKTLFEVIVEEIGDRFEVVDG